MQQERFDLGRAHIARMAPDMDKTSRRTQSTQVSSVRMLKFSRRIRVRISSSSIGLAAAPEM
jgi:hypothetical protein